MAHEAYKMFKMSLLQNQAPACPISDALLLASVGSRFRMFWNSSFEDVAEVIGYTHVRRGRKTLNRSGSRVLLALGSARRRGLIAHGKDGWELTAAGESALGQGYTPPVAA